MSQINSPSLPADVATVATKLLLLLLMLRDDAASCSIFVSAD
jgi:hypothetical protein